MKRGYVKSSPYFFRLIKLAMTLLVAALLVSAWLVPAPLEPPADIARVPNPVKSAWFLLWIQELVSYSKYLIYAVVAVSVAALLLPWLVPGRQESAVWLDRNRRAVNLAALFFVTALLLLTVIAMFFRGANWAFVPPF